MGNTCVGPSIPKNGIFQFVSAAIWRSPVPDGNASSVNGGESGKNEGPAESESNRAVQSTPPVQVTIPKTEPLKVETSAKKPEEAQKEKPEQEKKPFKRNTSAGLRMDSVLQRQTGNLEEFFSIGKKLGQGQFGTTFLCIEKGTGKQYACKSIAKRKLLTDEDVEDVRREIQIMHHLAGHPNVISIKGAYEDAIAVHVVMEFCAGGELFDRIIQRGH